LASSTDIFWPEQAEKMTAVTKKIKILFFEALFTEDPKGI
jgi:hypothetical protein